MPDDLPTLLARVPRSGMERASANAATEQLLPPDSAVRQLADFVKQFEVRMLALCCCCAQLWVCNALACCGARLRMAWLPRPIRSVQPGGPRLTYRLCAAPVPHRCARLQRTASKHQASTTAGADDPVPVPVPRDLVPTMERLLDSLTAADDVAPDVIERVRAQLQYARTIAGGAQADGGDVGNGGGAVAGAGGVAGDGGAAPSRLRKPAAGSSVGAGSAGRGGVGAGAGAGAGAGVGAGAT